MEKELWPGWQTNRVIGTGSYGKVYEIEREVLGKPEKAALKVISIPREQSDLDELYSEGYNDESITKHFRSFLEDIISEYSLMNEMKGHTNIVCCDDIRYVQKEDSPGWDIYIKMELLTPLIKALPAEIPEQTAILVGKDLARALTLCKSRNIIHRDIKPQNIFVSRDGDYKLGDFGIAKTTEKTSGGTKIGTYKYMAPEVYNNLPYGTSADIYSLGMVMYWLLNERRVPFLPLPPEIPTAREEEDACNRRFRGDPLPAPAHGSEALKRIVLKACEYKPENRYTSAAELLHDLEALAVCNKQTTVTADNAPELSETVALSYNEDDPTERTVLLYDEKNDLTQRVGESIVKSDLTEKIEQPGEYKVPAAQPIRQGAEHAAEKQVPKTQNAPQAVAPAKKSKWWIAAIGIGAAILAVGVIVLLAKLSAPKSIESNTLSMQTVESEQPIIASDPSAPSEPSEPLEILSSETIVMTENTAPNEDEAKLNEFMDICDSVTEENYKELGKKLLPFILEEGWLKQNLDGNYLWGNTIYEEIRTNAAELRCIVEEHKDIPGDLSFVSVAEELCYWSNSYVMLSVVDVEGDGEPDYFVFRYPHADDSCWNYYDMNGDFFLAN